MNILVTAPTEMELAPFIASNNKLATYFITGVGGPATIYNLQKKLLETNYDLVIQVGICGSFKPEKYQIGEVLLIEKDIFGDLGIIENNEFMSMAEMRFVTETEKDFKNGWMENENPLFYKLSTRKATAISMNTITDDKAHETIFSKKYGPDLESMEGAAFHYVCLQEKIPFLQLRAVSNAVGERDKTTWRMVEAIENLNNTLIHMLPEIIKEN